jgi:acyl-CoA reductase-like NAD-dependent aldehyde dehydrogenase
LTRLPVKKTYKLYIGGEFPRSESGRIYEAEGANVARGSRKDLRDAVRAARAAFPKWASLTAYNRGQVVYRIAEMLESRRSEFADLSTGAKEVDRSIDRLVWYAGWADKVTQVLGNANPVAGPFFNLSTPEPTGVVAVLAPQDSSLLGLVSVVAPAIVTGNTVVVVSSYERPLPAVTFSEVLATSDVPGGVVNILTGSAATVGPWLASHMDVNAIDLTGIAGDATLATDLEVASADNLKRVRRAPGAEPDWTLDPGLDAMTAFLETKTVWHPIGV